MKGLCQLALKVFLYTFRAAIGGLCAAFALGLLTAAPASAATQGPAGGVLGSSTSAGNGSATGSSAASGSQSGGGSLVSVNGGGSVNLPVSALSNGSGNGPAT